MSASHEPIIREIEQAMRPTPGGAGLELTITITAYDKGMIQVDGVPMAGNGWLSAAEVVVQKLTEFRRQVKRGRPKRKVA
jgi:hypothetical protein